MVCVVNVNVFENCQMCINMIYFIMYINVYVLILQLLLFLLCW